MKVSFSKNFTLTNILVALTVVLLFPLYQTPVQSMMQYWEHEYLLILISLLLIFWKRKEVYAVEKKQNYLGLIIMVLSLLFYLAVKRGDIQGLMYATSIPLIFGMVLYLGGKKLAGLLIFPIFFLIFTVRSGFVDSVLSIRLRIFSTIFSTAIVDVLGIPAQRVGTYVYTPDVQYDIASPCSGLNSLNSLVPLSFLFAFLTQKKLWRRAVIVIMGVPIALFANTSRIAGIALAARGFGAKFALKAFHDWSGYFTFGFGLLCLFGISQLLGKIPGKEKSQVTSHKSQVEENGQGIKVRSQGSEVRKQKTTYKKHILLHLGIVIGLLVLTLGGAKYTERARYFSRRLNFNNIPLEIVGWKGADLEISEKEIKGLPLDTEHFKRAYTKGESKILLAIVQSKADRHSIHPPEACFPGQGWSLGMSMPLKIGVGEGKILTASRFEAGFQKYRELVIYWYQTEYLTTTRFPLISLITAKDLILYGRNDRWAFIRLSSPLGEKAEETEEGMKDFIRDLWKYVQYEDSEHEDS